MHLRRFYREYEKDRIHVYTEFERGYFSGWRHLLQSIYGDQKTQVILDAIGANTGNQVPPCGPLDREGEYTGFDQFAGRYIGTTGNPHS